MLIHHTLYTILRYTEIHNQSHKNYTAVHIMCTNGQRGGILSEHSNSLSKEDALFECALMGIMASGTLSHTRKRARGLPPRTVRPPQRASDQGNGISRTNSREKALGSLFKSVAHTQGAKCCTLNRGTFRQRECARNARNFCVRGKKAGERRAILEKQVFCPK